MVRADSPPNWRQVADWGSKRILGDSGRCLGSRSAKHAEAVAPWLILIAARNFHFLTGTDDLEFLPERFVYLFQCRIHMRRAIASELPRAAVVSGIRTPLRYRN